MGQVLHWGLLQGREPVGVAVLWGAEVGGYSEGDRGGLVRRSWIDGSEERIWDTSQRIRLIGEGQDIRCDVRRAGGVRVLETME